ncbi:hypothetical protein NP570_23965 [Vibrio parahaemolyticus]|nr:hypothetical protein [Vibrio parahaemolyticus]
MSALFSTEHDKEQDIAFSAELMQAFGKVCWVEQESGINKVFAADVSAPEYILQFRL